MNVNNNRETLTFDRLSSDQIIKARELEYFCFDDPWSENLWQYYLPQTYALVESDQLLAYAQCSIVLNEAELLRIAVAPSHQGKGLGKLMLITLLNQLKQQCMERLMLEVRASNKAAIALYSASGLSLEGRRKGYYETKQAGQREDALLMSVNL